MYIKLNINHCPSKETIEYHKNKSQYVFNNEIITLIDKFFSDNIEESFNIEENIFEDTWIFALVMGMCGEKYFETNIAIAYNRSDGNNCASIGVVNKVKKYNRLLGELTNLEEKIKNLQKGSSKYEKAIDKIERIKSDMEKYKPINIE